MKHLWTIPRSIKTIPGVSSGRRDLLIDTFQLPVFWCPIYVLQPWSIYSRQYCLQMCRFYVVTDSPPGEKAPLSDNSTLWTEFSRLNFPQMISWVYGFVVMFSIEIILQVTVGGGCGVAVPSWLLLAVIPISALQISLTRWHSRRVS